MSANRWRETWLRGCLELLDWGNHGDDGEMELKLTLNGDAECLVVGPAWDADWSLLFWAAGDPTVDGV